MHSISLEIILLVGGTIGVALAFLLERQFENFEEWKEKWIKEDEEDVP